ncbi:MAG TPA: MFS transporter [Longimicrobiaceae bacterium]
MIDDPQPAKPRAVLARLGLDRPELRAWAMYDWAVSSVQTTIMVAVFPIFYKLVVARDLPDEVSTGYIAAANSVAMGLIAVLSPVLGALADYTAAHKRLLGLFMGLGASAVAAMFFLRQGHVWLGFWLFVAALVGAAGSMVFYESLLPHVASENEIDRVSTAGYGLGYAGGGTLLALNLAWILFPGAFGLSSADSTLPTRLALLSVAAWWVLFSVPLFRRVANPPRTLEPDETPRTQPVRGAFIRLWETLRALRGYRQAFLMLLAFLVYNDGIQTIIKMATAYGTDLGIGQNALIAAILIVQFVGIPFAFLFGMLAGRIGTKPAIFTGLAAYTAISILGYFMTNALHFFVLAGLVGMVQGGTQALSRSLFASMVPPHRSGEFFGFFSVFEKFAGIFGPLFFAVSLAVTGSSRNAILSVILFFVVGGLLLALVDVQEGRRVAQEAELGVREVGAA